MKLKLIADAALAALTAAAMPTKDEIAQANKEVQVSLKRQIAAWQSGDISDGDLAALMFMNADKFKDDARHYACLQAAFAAAVRADDAAFAAKALTRIFMETKDFTPALGEKLIDRTLVKMDATKAASFRKRLEEERAKNIFESSALVAAKLDKIVLPSVSFKPPATLADVVKFLNEASVQYDFEPNKKGVKFVLSIGDDTPPAIPRISAKNMRLRDLLQLIGKIVKCDYSVEGDVVKIVRSVVADKMDKIMVPSATIKPPATLVDAVQILRELSWKYDPSKNNKGLAFILADATNPPKMPKIAVNNIKFKDLLKLIVDSVGYAYAIEGDVVRIYKK